jgi:outer membrane protein TolC
MEIRTSYWKLDQYRTDYESAKSQLEEAEKLIEIAKVQDEEGLITFVELQDAQLAHDAIMLQYYQSLYNYNNALIDFNMAMGR